MASEFLDLYAQGRYAEFARLLDGMDANLPFSMFEGPANDWIDSESSDRSRRRLVAATVALEMAHILRDQPAYVAADYFVWASKRMQDEAGEPSDLERLWHLAAIAGMQEQAIELCWPLAAGEWGNGIGALSLRPNLLDAMRHGGQLAIAARRFPAEPRFRLGQLEAQEAIAAVLDPAPPFLSFIKAQAAAQVIEDSPFREAQNAAFVRNQAADILKRRERIPTLIAGYRALEGHEVLRPEVALHIGYLEGVQEHWPEALIQLQRASELTTEPVLRYLSYFFAGRIAQVVGDTAGAIAAFEAADAVVPGARSGLTLLAAELMRTGGHDDWNRAYDLLRRANDPESPTDPWWLYRRGDAYLWSRHMARLREALR